MSAPVDLSTSLMVGPLDSRRQDSSHETVAEEFEALLLSYMLKTMRESVESSGLFEDGAAKDIYSGILDQEVARALAQKGGLGIAKLLNSEYFQAKVMQENTD